MKSRKLLAIPAFAAAFALTLVGCASDPGSGGSGGASGRGELVLGVLQEPASWDPGQAHVGHRLQPFQAAYDTLILRQADGTYAPMLATKWGYTDKAGMVFSLDLRTDVTFSDGEKFNAAAVVANIEHFKKDNGPQAAQGTAIGSVKAVDDDTVEITMAKPDPALEYYLSQALGLMGSPKAIGTDAIDRTPVGSGPYVMVADQSVVGSQYVFKARDGYWNPGLQKFDGITLKLLDDVTSRVNAITSGEVQATLLDATTVQQAESSGLTKLEYPTDWQGLLLMDRDGKLNKALGDVRVRQAINYALDRETMLKSLGGGYGEVTSQVFGPASTAYVADLDTRYTFDQAKAKQLLADAGYAKGLTIEMPVLTPGFETLMTMVTQQLADVGITVKQTSVPGADYQGLLGQGKFSAAAFNIFQGPSWVASKLLLSTDGLYNPFDSATPELTKQLDALQANGDDKEAAQAINTYVTENAWFAPWFRPSQLYFYDSKKLKVEPQIQQAVPSIYNYSPVS